MRSAQPSQLVTIAASAGGIRALCHVLSALPADFTVPLVIVQHRTPHTPDLLVKVLGRSCRLPVQLAQPGERLCGGVVYVAPADKHLLVGPGYELTLTNGPRIHHVRSSADPLFSSAAAASGGGIVAVVLTGGDADASGGVLAVKSLGGTVIVQDQATSECFGMPSAAIRTGAVDYILPLDEIGPMLVRLTREPALVHPSTAPARDPLLTAGPRSEATAGSSP